LYPLRFQPRYVEKIWGGQKIRTVLGKDFGAAANCGETWEVSGVPGHLSIVAAGPLAGQSLADLLRTHRADLAGQSVYDRFGNTFPLLIKFIDAADDLSIQVHPDDALAQQRHGSFGKTEMWYIFDADPGSRLFVGFNQDLDPASYQAALDEGRILDVIHTEAVSPGDVYFIPAGRVHSIGKGLLLAEIQQTSDVTYRLYDFDRVDANGQGRELHTELALDAIDFDRPPTYATDYDREAADVELASCPYFQTHRLALSATMTRDLSGRDSFTIFICVGGGATLQAGDHHTSLRLGDVILVPACLSAVQLIPDGQVSLLETWVP
ncbi:MAG: mannose-6-phosphate isomerase, partial [Bacteroidetes bacterium]